MVRNKLGVGGCATCRKRKIKCDGAKPACRKCKERNVECDGYQINSCIKFVVQTGRKATTIDAGTSRKRTGQRSISNTDTNLPYLTSQNPSQKQRTALKDFAVQLSSAVPAVLPVPLKATSMSELYLGYFQSLILKLHQPMSFAVAPGFAPHSQIFCQVEISQPPNSQDVVRQAAFALGSLNLASRLNNNDRPWVLVESLRYYSIAVTSLRNALASTTQSVEYLSYIAYAILLLAVYEVENGKYDAWGAHVLAVGSILRKIGPQRALKVISARVLYFHYATHARLHQVLGKVKCEFLGDEWIQLYDLSQHTFMITRTQAIRAFVYDDAQQAVLLYEQLREMEKLQSGNFELSDRSTSLMLRIEVLTFLTVLSGLICQIEIKWAAITFQFLVQHEMQLDMYNSFLALQVIGHSQEIPKDQRLWCLMKIKHLLTRSSTNPEEVSPRLTHEISQAIIAVNT